MKNKQIHFQQTNNEILTSSESEEVVVSFDVLGFFRLILSAYQFQKREKRKQIQIILLESQTKTSTNIKFTKSK